MIPAQADFLIASPKKPDLVIAPREGAQDLETLLEMEEQGPWTDQFWRWRVPRT
ncbi:hypothetical protein [Nonomuraea sp. NPDC003804]|uniref:hypothetical protein n=1 Tax=Nonomuraea sp. NPDC003804 TaxID=3154547 RepID=UPI0033AAF328